MSLSEAPLASAFGSLNVFHMKALLITAILVKRFFYFLGHDLMTNDTGGS